MHEILRAGVEENEMAQIRAKRKIYLRYRTRRANLTSHVGKNKMSYAPPHESSPVGCDEESFVQVLANI